MKATFKRPPGLDRTAAAQAPGATLPRLFVAVPCYGGMMTAQTAEGLANLFLSLHVSGLKFKHNFLVNESLVTRARNRQVAAFLQSDCTHLLFIDADIGFRAKDVQPLLACDEDVVFGAYPKKSYGWDAMREAAKAGASAEDMRMAGALYAINAPDSQEVEIVERFGAHLIEVKEASTGFMLIKRSALERFIAHYQDELAYVSDSPESQGDTHHMVFQAGLDPMALRDGHAPRYLSEDFWWCRKWQMMGGKVWLCLDCKLSHTGTHTWAGDVSTLLRSEPTEAAPAKEAEPHRVQVEMVEPAA